MSSGRTMSDETARAANETRTFLDARPSPDVRAAVMSRIEGLEPLASPRRFGMFLARIASLSGPPVKFQSVPPSRSPESEPSSSLGWFRTKAKRLP